MNLESSQKRQLMLNDFISSFFFDNSEEIFIVLDKELKFKEVNKKFLNLLSFQFEEIQGRMAMEFIHQEDSPRIQQLITSPLDDSKASIVFRFISKEGKFIFLESKFHKVSDFTLIIAEDVTKRKEVQEELRTRNRELEEEKAKFTEILENIGDGIIGINDQGEIIFVNPQVIILLGFNENELLGKMLVHTIKLINDRGSEIPIQQRPVHNALLAKKKVTENKFSYLKKDGKVLPVSITATPIILHELIVGGVVVFRDITREREVDRMKTEFISLASHQLRTPLSAMKWFTELVLDDSENLTEEQRKLIQNVYQSNERMIELVNALLNISRIESGRIIIDPKPTDLALLVKEVIQELQPRVDEKNQHLGVSVIEVLPKINIDPKLIRHVYMNLLTNAIKYTQPGGEIVVVISSTDNEIISQVYDNGYGIPEKQQKQVFEKFFRADNIIKIETDGSGLGLYLTKAIVESSGGKIWFKSESGRGTTFWFSLLRSGSISQKAMVSIDDRMV